MRNMNSRELSIPSLQFNPDKHPDATLEGFNKEVLYKKE